MSEEITFTDKDIARFRHWLGLNLDGLTWQGRYKKEFEELWNLVFAHDLSLLQIAERLGYACKESKIGPLGAWFNWLLEKFICYLFIFYPLSVSEIARRTKMDVSEVSSAIRSFLVDAHPHLEEEFNEYFQISYIASPSAKITFEEIMAKLGIERPVRGSHDDDIMPSLEVTLYEEWGDFLVKMKKIFIVKKIDFEALRKKASVKSQLKIVAEVLILILIGFGVISLVKFSNIKYTNYLVEKIKIYEPQFAWLDRTLTFKIKDDTPATNFKLELEDIDEIQDLPMEIFEEEQRFEAESEVTLTSWDSLPRDFGAADLERSAYEENVGASGYRETSFGNTKVYRIIMKSVDTLSTRKALNDLMSKYGVTQVDNVRPGQDVPGGIYYNLYVQREFLKEFVAQVIEVDEAIIYESRATVRTSVPGKNKVFIYVKKI
jgi:hypothetical protein